MFASTRQLSAALIFTALASLGLAQERSDDDRATKPAEAKEPDESQLIELRLSERVNVIGDAGRVFDLPGSAYVIESEELAHQKQGFDDVQRMLRQVPGVVIQEEEGYGLRPNIGLRGTGTERSSKITLMEDGVLIAPAPYVAPAAYYFPVAGRMDAIEVRKGSSQVKFGPSTNGGVLNLISTPVPPQFRLDADVALGSEQTRKIGAAIGDAYANFGWNFETYHLATDGFKVLDGGGDTGFDLQDYVGKLRFHTSPTSRVFQELEVKLGYARETGDETYLGITDGDFAETPLRRYAGSQIDNIEWDHEMYTARHFLALPNGLDLTTVVYRNDFHRNWYKLDSIAGVGLSSLFEDEGAYARELAIARGADSAPGDLSVRANDRTYYSQGVQSTVGLDFGTRTTHDVEIGFRFHQDQEDRFQQDDRYQMLNGRMSLTRAGAPGSQTNRVSNGDALAVFVQDEIGFRRFRLTPGVRFETIDFLRTDYGSADPDRLSPTGERRNSVNVAVPGVGLTFDWKPDLRLFGGVHRGFSPPGAGADADTQPEESVNYELGLRSSRGRVESEAIFFYNDYQNLLGADTLSSGGTGEGDLFNGGEARALGLELSASADAGPRFGLELSVPLRASYTYTNAIFQNTFESGFEPWGDVEAGDSLPYLPRHQFYASVALEGASWLAGLNATATSRMRTQAGQGDFVDRESTDAFAVLNVFAEYEVASSARVFVSVQNLADATYIVARAPAGVRPGLPRTLMAGIKFRVGS
jgi:Fe(3+) dicitrate transport protein